MDNGLQQLKELCESKDWYSDIEALTDRYVVYVNYLNATVLEAVPNTMGNKQVVVHFSVYKEATTNKFVNLADFRPKNREDVELDLEELKTEVLAMRTVCDSPADLSDILIAIQDGTKTELSVKYQKVKKKMEALLEQYGFDILYEQINDDRD